MEKFIVFGVLLAALALFISGRWRYDLVALMALLAVVLAGIVPAPAAFTGFAHPAVITVAAVLIVSRGLLVSGMVDLIARGISRVGQRPIFLVIALTSVVALASGFMNNVGALALLMPVAIRLARRGEFPASLLLMPLAFGSLLGGLITVIGTPPNIIIATFRAEAGDGPFRMFDFAPVGLGVTLAGVIFISLVGWRLVPKREDGGSREQLFAIQEYTTELKVPENSGMVGKSVRQLESAAEGEVTVAALVRGEQRLHAPIGLEVLNSGDILVVEAEAEGLQSLVDQAGLELVADGAVGEESLRDDEVGVVEAIVMLNSPLAGRTAGSLDLRWRYGVNLLAVARHGSRLEGRLSSARLKVGDVLLLQGKEESLPEALSMLGCLPLAEREVALGYPRRLLPAVGIFGVALAVAAVGLLQVQVAFAAAALVMVLVGVLSLRQAYESIDWPIVVLLGAMIPVGQALETTGGAQFIADGLQQIAGGLPLAATLGILMVGAMLLSNVVNNAAAAVLVAPIAILLAGELGVSSDPFLMATAVGASCAFLTPIGHQSNTLVMGPGGYRFGDYWRMGLPLSAIVVLVAVPLILWSWPP